jgi:hypothetical protein
MLTKAQFQNLFKNHKFEIDGKTYTDYAEYEACMSVSKNEIAQRNGKYNSIRTEANGIKFASKKEAEFYKKLLLLKQSGEIIDIQLQPEFILQEGYIKDGKKVRPIKYIADFMVKYKDGNVEIIDTKGFRKNKVYLLKKKMFHYKYKQLTIREV